MGEEEEWGTLRVGACVCVCMEEEHYGFLLDQKQAGGQSLGQSPLPLVKLGLQRVSKHSRSMLVYRTFPCIDEPRAADQDRTRRQARR